MNDVEHRLQVAIARVKILEVLSALPDDEARASAIRDLIPAAKPRTLDADPPEWTKRIRESLGRGPKRLMEIVRDIEATAADRATVGSILSNLKRAGEVDHIDGVWSLKKLP